MKKFKKIILCICSLFIILIVVILVWILFFVNIAKLAGIYYFKGDYDKAIKYYNIAVKKAVNNQSISYYKLPFTIKNKKNKINISDYYTKIGLSYFEKGNLEKAEEYINKSLKINVSKNDRIKVERDNINLTSIEYEKEKNTDETIEKMGQSLKFFYEIKNKNEEIYVIIANLYNSLGELYENKKLYNEAIKYTEMALKINQNQLKEKNIFDIILNYNNLGGLYLEIGNHKKAIANYKKGLEIANKFRLNTKYIIVKKLKINLNYALEKMMDQIDNLESIQG